MKSNQPITILSGAFGTELQRRGFPTNLPLWSAGANLSAPQLVQEIHADYLRAGANLITTNTFRTNIRTWQRIGKRPLAKESTKRAIEHAVKTRNKINPKALVGGSITTVEDCYSPNLVPARAELEEEHGEMVEYFAGEGLDFIILETMNTLLETEVLLAAAKPNGLPVWVSFVTNPAGDLLSGERLEDAVALAKQFDVEAILLNCRPPLVIQAAADKLVANYSGVKGIYANGHGEPSDGLGWKFHENITPKTYLEHAKHWAKQGFSIIGGCCGTTPEYIELLAENLS